MAGRVPSQTEIMRRAAEAQLLDVRTSMAGVIVSFDANTMRASVQPGVRVRVVDLDTPAEVDTMPVIPDVPVLFPSCAFGILYFPLAPGDPVRLEFSEEDDSEFYWNADAVVPVNPSALRRHGAACVCRPSGFRGTGALEGENPSKTFLGKPGGVGIQMDHDEVKLGGSGASDMVALASKVDGELTKISTTLASLTGTASFTTAYVKAPVGASKVKAL